MKSETDSMKFNASEVSKSKSEALQKIKDYLNVEDVDGQFSDRSGDYYSRDKFIVTWKGNYMGHIPAEYGIDKCDSFYAGFSGNKAIYVTRGLFHEKQLGAYHSIERALIEVGMKLCSKKDKKEFFDKYAVKYNSKLQALKTTS